MAQLLPSIFGADLLNLQEEIKFLENKEVEILHVDLMDGNFVSFIAFGAYQIKKLKENSNMKFDVHMMTANPARHLDSVLETGAELISVHYESTPHIHLLLKKIRENGRKAGVVLNPSTSEEVLKYLLDYIDYILVMSINPGEPGGTFIPETLAKIKNVSKMIGDRDISIEVDGGVTPEIAEKCVKAGANLIVAGGSLFNGDKAKNYGDLMDKIK